eukprot:2143683-Pyramimonas_sp.AAC.1
MPRTCHCNIWTCVRFFGLGDAGCAAVPEGVPQTFPKRMLVSGAEGVPQTFPKRMLVSGAGRCPANIPK